MLNIHDQLRAEILEGKLAPGSKLRLEELKRRFGVSLSPLREALSRLVAEGIVVAESQRGFNVAPVSRAIFTDVIRLRAKLECMAFQEAIEKGDDQWENGIVVSLHQLKKIDALRAEVGSIEVWERRHSDFHMALICACESKFLLQFCGTLRDMNDRYRRIFLDHYNIHSPGRDSVYGHQAIADAALTRNGELAVSLLNQHIHRTAQNVFKMFDDSKAIADESV